MRTSTPIRRLDADRCNTNALPKPLRDYIHALPTGRDPAGTIRQNVTAQWGTCVY